LVTPILVVSADPSLAQQMIDLLQDKPFAIAHCKSAATAADKLTSGPTGIVIFDLDQADLDERYFRQLARMKGLCIMGLSDRPFHPDLKEAIGRHLLACLRKPIDADELLFFIDSAAKNGCTRHC
jgi:DNA-binding response OmpR family regulator